MSTVTNLRDLLIASAKRQQPPRLRISQAGSDCVRRTYYEATGAPHAETDPEGLVKMALGSALDEWALQRAPAEIVEGSWIMQLDVELEMGGLTVTGHPDAIHYGPGGPDFVSDLKTVGDKTWAKIQKAPKQEHAAQVNLYAFAICAPRWSVCYVNASTGEIIEHFGDTDAFAARKDFGLFEEAAFWIARNLPPPRPYEDFADDETGETKIAADSYPCAFCAFRATCWTEGIADERKDENHVDVQEA